ncbi:Uncharacterized protein HZ326_21761 [Fusarium oxysporum f. sp. albedinis]|nr:Uncharacterized protein HZ326_21761 [Fusarium oxysporum f. sp. albedinis]
MISTLNGLTARQRKCLQRVAVSVSSRGVCVSSHRIRRMLSSGGETIGLRFLHLAASLWMSLLFQRWQAIVRGNSA